jgi:hypothetical protein
LSSRNNIICAAGIAVGAVAGIVRLEGRRRLDEASSIARDGTHAIRLVPRCSPRFAVSRPRDRCVRGGYHCRPRSPRVPYPIWRIVISSGKGKSEPMMTNVPSATAANPADAANCARRSPFNRLRRLKWAPTQIQGMLAIGIHFRYPKQNSVHIGNGAPARPPTASKSRTR